MTNSSTSTELEANPSPPVIGTHSGTFHCDEALAVFLLRLLPAYKDATIVRTRNREILDTCTIVVDVGGVYDHSAKIYDHHQKGFEENFGNGFVTKLSSAGLIYKHYGPAILSSILSLPESHATITTLLPKLYANFVEAVDGIDNGIRTHERPGLYTIKTSLSSRVKMLNPRWNEVGTDSVRDEKFLVASEMAGREFLALLDFYAQSWIPARQIVLDAVKKRKGIHDSGKVMVLEIAAPWKAHLYEIEGELRIPEPELPIYLIFHDKSQDQWLIQAIPKSSETTEAGEGPEEAPVSDVRKTRENRKPFPEEWRGFVKEQLDEITGVAGGTFVHSKGYIAGHKTKVGALAMALKALEL